MSKKRTKSTTRAKETESKGVLKPTQANNISSEIGSHSRKSEKFYLRPLKEEFTYEKDILRPFTTVDHEGIKENFSKSEYKLSSRYKQAKDSNYSPQSVILKESGSNTIT